MQVHMLEVPLRGSYEDMVVMNADRQELVLQ